MQGRYRRRHERRSTPSYQPGLYSMMDWVASRLHKAGAAVWAIIFNLDEVDCLFEVALFAA
jgi:hypothetical protein